MTIDQLQEGYYYFLREVYSLTGILRRHRGPRYDLPRAVSHFARNYLLSRYGMIKTAHAIRRRSAKPVKSVDAEPHHVEPRSITDASNAPG